MMLLQKTNADWWSAKRSNGQEGYLPANYVQEVEPKVIKKIVKKPIKIPVKVMVMKTGVRREPIAKQNSSKLRRTPSGKPKQALG